VIVAALSTYPPGVRVLLLSTGVLIGLLAGLLDIGGGVIAVPVLLEVFAFLGIDDATATSLLLARHRQVS
jgi:uncharacterized membrane protein YfcA